MKGAPLEARSATAKQQVQQLHCPFLGGQAGLQPRSIRSNRLKILNRDRVMAIAAEPLVAEENNRTQRPDRDGRFGRFGGKYVSQLIPLFTL